MTAGFRPVRNFDPAAACAGKDRFTREQAKEVAQARRKASGKPVQPYRCQGCGSWHIGSLGVKRSPQRPSLPGSEQ